MSVLKIFFSICTGQKCMSGHKLHVEVVHPFISFFYPYLVFDLLI